MMYFRLLIQCMNPCPRRTKVSEPKGPPLTLKKMSETTAQKSTRRAARSCPGEPDLPDTSPALPNSAQQAHPRREDCKITSSPAFYLLH